MNIQGDSHEPLQASLLMKVLNQERFYAIGEQYIRNLPKQLQSKISKGISYNYTKLVNNEDVEIMFPMIMGVPFYFKYKNPVAVQLNGEIQGKVQSDKYSLLPKSANLTGELQALYASSLDGRVGFYCTLSNKYVTAGIQRKFQVNIPITFEADVDFVNADIELAIGCSNKQRSQIFYQSVTPYTTIRDRNSNEVPLESKQTQIIRKSQPEVSYENYYGQRSTGVAFKVKVVQDNKPQRNYDMSKEEFISNLIQPFYDEIPQYAERSVYYEPHNSANNKMRLYLSYGEYP